MEFKVLLRVSITRDIYSIYRVVINRLFLYTKYFLDERGIGEESNIRIFVRERERYRFKSIHGSDPI